MTDLLQELMNDVRADRTQDLWKKYGKWVIYAAVSIVILTAVSVYWSYHKREEAMRQTALYLEANDLLAKGDAAQALKSLEQISVPARSSYYGLVLLKKAQAESALGKGDEAQKTLAELAKRGDVYADVGKSMLKDAPAEDAKKVSALQFTRSEWAAWDLLGKGQNVKAAEQFSALAKMPDVPATLRDRALMMANYLKNKTGASNE